MRHYEMPHHQNGHAGPRVPTHPMHFDIPQRNPELPLMPGAGYQHMRIILFANEVGAPTRGGHWTRDDARLTIAGDDNEQALAVPPQRIACLRHFPEPGREVAAVWSDVRDLVEGQLAHPERLRDSHLLRCHAQVYEAMVPQQVENLAMAMLGDASLAGQLRPLSEQLAARLNLAAALPRRSARPPHQRDAGAVLAGDLLIRLRISEDPTRDIAATGTLDHASLVAAPRQPSAPPRLMTNPARRPAIPEKYMQPWELRRSREEAIYEMHFAASPGWWRRLLRVFSGASVSRREFLRWEIMVSGKEIEDQLWGVRPPAGGLRHPKVRDWAARTLALAGHDPNVMLTEWEIYWRRKAD